MFIIIGFGDSAACMYTLYDPSLEAWALNPARDFGPRLFAYLMGWGAQALPAPGNYWWVPIAGPLMGGVAGAAAY